MSVNIQALPEQWVGKKFKPLHPPIFPGDEPTEAEVRLAIALIEALDSASRAWYGEALLKRLRARLR